MKFRFMRGMAVALALHFSVVANADEPARIERVESAANTEIYAPGASPRWKIKLRNLSAQTLSGARLSWELSSWSKASTTSAAPARVDEPAHQALPDILAGEAHDAVVEVHPARLGWHELRLELRDRDGGLLARDVRRFSVGTTPRSTGEFFRYGLCSHMLRHAGTPIFEAELALADQLGVDTVRTELAGWESTEPTEGRFDFSKPDLMLAALAPLGIEIQPIFAYSTRWSSTGDPNAKDWNDWNKTAPRLAPWLNYVGKVVDRYGDRVRYWEIWNEPDISFWRASTAQYIELFDASSALIKKKTPRAQVLNGGFAMVSREPNPDFVARFVASASPANWDVFAYHDYHSFAQFQARRSEVDAHYSAVRKKLPLWINEGGAHTLLAGGDNGQALTLVKKIASAPSRGVSAYFWYNLRDDGLDPKDPEHHFGLTFHDGQPKPAWSAYQNLIRELGAACHLRSMPPAEVPAGVWAHLYARRHADAPASGADTSHVLVIWQEGASRSIPHWLSPGAEARIVSVRDLMGNEIANTSFASGGAVLALTDAPVYVQIQTTNGREPSPSLRPLIEPPSYAVLTPGKSTPLAIKLNNPFEHAVTMRISLDSDVPDLRITPATSEQNIVAGGAGATTFSLALPATTTGAPRAPRLALHITAPETGLALDASVPATIALTIPRIEGSAAQAAAIALESRDDIVNLYSAEPLPAMQWRGPEDLSATMRVAHDTSALRILVDVRDDIHRQAETKDKLWTADSMQLGLRFDETRGDYVEIGLARTEDGRVGGWVFATDSTIPLARGRLGAPIDFDVVRDDARAITAYRLEIPWSELGLDGPPVGGFRLSMLANDDDGRGRKQWVQLSGGLGDEKNPALWRVFTCR